MSPSSARIRALNDAFRKFPFRPLGELYMTPGVANLPVGDRASVLGHCARFDAFTPDNDPHGEHDFGAFQYDGERYFWKIDYWDRSQREHSRDPADPSVTCRVMTVMRADEY